MANHYSLPRGRAALLKAVSDYMSPSFKLGRPLDPNSEVQITAGANEGALSLLALRCTAFLIRSNAYRNVCLCYSLLTRR